MGVSRYTVDRLAGFVVRGAPPRLPPAAVAAARRAVLDLIAAAIAGVGSDAAAAARRTALSVWGSGESGIWWSGRGARLSGAVFANCVAASILDLDDGHRAAGGHPGAAVVPTALAVAMETGANGAETLAAITLGYEIAIRIGAARHLEGLDTFATGRWCGFGAVAAAGYLRRTPARTLAQALAIAGIHAPNLSASGYSSIGGHHVKEGIPWATVTGLAALDLATAGYTGPLDLLDHPDYWVADRIVAGLGDGWLIESAYRKRYACCRWLHAALDALLELRAAHAIDGADIEAIEVATFARVLRLPNDVAPPTIEAAEYSLPFCLALAALDGAGAFLPMRDAVLRRQDVVELAARVRIRIDPDLDRRFPAGTPARVTVATVRGRFTRQVDHPKGDPQNPLTDAEIEAKFRQLADGVWDDATQDAALTAVARLEEDGPQPLVQLLARPAT